MVCGTLPSPLVQPMGGRMSVPDTICLLDDNDTTPEEESNAVMACAAYMGLHLIMK